MKRTAMRRAGLAIAAVTVFTAGCTADAPSGIEVPAMALAETPVDLGSCGSLAAPEGSTFGMRLYAAGVQIYRWDGAAWSFVAPRATLFADPEMRGAMGTHFGGPTWETITGSRVVGALRARCTPNAAAIPWLLLDVVSSGGGGAFEGTTSIQRINTTGGMAPSEPGSVTGEVREVPYTADYVFYRVR